MNSLIINWTIRASSTIIVALSLVGCDKLIPAPESARIQFACPPLTEYTADHLAQLKKEVHSNQQEFGNDSMVTRVVKDYGLTRDLIRNCVKARDALEGL